MCRSDTTESAEIIRCLKLYGDASGQEINKLKSSIIFGAKVEESVKTEVKEVLGIDAEGGDGSYLGLPECFKGSKKQLLNFIREKLQGRLQGYYAKALSQGGKEILLKSVCLALPVYSMSVFKLPKALCSKLTSIMMEFWWSSGDNRKKIAWVAWQRLCRSKAEGGLGFHDISHFNQSLLAKQAWRIWSNPDSLLSRILQSRYFKNGSFLTCGIGTRPSYAWRSIMHGRELLNMGLVRSIGDGTSTNVWTENWIKDPIPRPPLYRQDRIVDLTLKVSDLIIPHTNLWDAHLVRQNFTEEDAAKVLLISPKPHLSDSQQWDFTNNGIYTSQSGYNLLELVSDLGSQPHYSLSGVERQLWSNIWKLKTSPKVRHFIWRALSGALAVADRLRSRGIPIDPNCKTCGAFSESICHTLFMCSAAKETWALSNLPLPPAGFSHNSVFLNLHHLIACTKSRRIEEKAKRSIPWILWHLWKARNNLVFRQIKYTPSTIVETAIEDSEAWFSANPPAPTTVELSITGSSSLPGWKKPPSNMLKCNVGASWINGTNNCGVSWILRDHHGKVLSHSRRFYSLVPSQQEAELLALHWAIDCSKSMRFDNIIFETDLGPGSEAPLSPRNSMLFPLLTANILSILEFFRCWSFAAVRSSENRIAQAIAKSVTLDHRYQSYIARNGPHWLDRMIISEASIHD